jgi:hypothetical protein
MSFSINHQDWGGRKPMNPPRVAYRHLYAYADAHRFSIKREGKGMWLYFNKERGWVTLGMTNYLALQELKHIVEHKK